MRNTLAFKTRGIGDGAHSPSLPLTSPSAPPAPLDWTGSKNIKDSSGGPWVRVARGQVEARERGSAAPRPERLLAGGSLGYLLLSLSWSSSALGGGAPVGGGRRGGLASLATNQPLALSVFHGPPPPLPLPPPPVPFFRIV